MYLTVATDRHKCSKDIISTEIIVVYHLTQYNHKTNKNTAKIVCFSAFNILNHI